MPIQKTQQIKLRQIASSTPDYESFAEQLTVMSEAWHYEVTPTNGQTVFTLPRAYQTGYKALKIFLNGQLQSTNGEMYVETNDTTVTFSEGLFNTDKVAFRVEGAGSGTTFMSDHGHVFREIPVGLIDGNNQVYVLSKQPVPGSECVYWNGALMSPGQDADYVITGKNITFAEPLVEGDKLIVNYIFAITSSI